MPHHTKRARSKTAKANISRIEQQKKLLQEERNKLARTLAKAGVKNKVASLKAERLKFKKQRTAVQTAKLRSAIKRAKKLSTAINRFF